VTVARVGVAQLGVLVERAVRAHVANRRLLVFGLVQPAIMLVLFTQVFGNIIDTDRLPAGVDASACSRSSTSPTWTWTPRRRTWCRGRSPVTCR
jgi:hypothetical protein